MDNEPTSQAEQSEFSGREVAEQLSKPETETDAEKAARSSRDRFYQDGGRVSLRFSGDKPDLGDRQGEYIVANGNLVYVDRDGQISAFVDTEENRQGMAEWGAKPSEDTKDIPMWFFNGNGEGLDPSTFEALSYMHGITAVREAAREIGVKLGQPVEGEWMDFGATGELVQLPNGEKVRQGALREEFQEDGLARAAKEAGHYSDNNGVVGFRDEFGKVHFAPSTQDRFDALRAAGYTDGPVSVPMSNQEQFVDFNHARKWDDMRRQASEA